MEDVEANIYAKKFTETYKLREKSQMSRQFVPHPNVPTLNMSFHKVLGLKDIQPEMTTSLKFRQMSTQRQLADPESDEENELPIEVENEFARKLNNRFRLPQLRDQKALNQIAFSRKNVVDSPKLPRNFQLKPTTGNVSAFKKLSPVATSPRGLRHQFKFSNDRLPGESFFDSSDLLDPDAFKKAALKKPEKLKQTSYMFTEAHSKRKWKTNPVETQASTHRVPPHIFSKTGYSGGDIWRKHAPNLKLNLMHQTKQVQPNLYHNMANVSNLPKNVTNRLSLLMNQDILKTNTNAVRLASKPTHLNGFLENGDLKPSKSVMPVKGAKELKRLPPMYAPTPDQFRIAGFIPMWTGSKGKPEIRNWSFNPKKQRKEHSFIKQFLSSCCK